MLPEPTVVAARARHRSVIEAYVEVGGVLRIREEVVLGRHGELGGAYRGLLRVDLAGAPLLRHELVLDGADPVSTGRGSAIGARTVGSLLVVDPEWTPPSLEGPDAAILALAGGGWLLTELAADRPTALPAVLAADPFDQKTGKVPIPH